MVDKKLLDVVSLVADEMLRREDEIVEANAAIGFVRKWSVILNRQTARMLKGFRLSLTPLENRIGICGSDDEIAFMLAYNMSSLACFFIAHQLAVGNRVRIKPSEIAWRSGKILESIWKAAAPDRVAFDFRPGAEFMSWAIKEANVKAIIFFGSHLVAFDYMDKIKATRKKFIMEGSGKNPFIVLEDADVEKAAKGLYQNRFTVGGQACSSPGRIYVHSSIFNEFIERFVKLTKHLIVGNPMDPRTDIGPVGSALAVSRIKEQLDDAQIKGAKIVLGDKVEGNLVYPTIITGADHSMKGMQEESFGPVCWLMPFHTVEEAIALAQDNKFGLNFVVYGHKGVKRIVTELKGQDYLHEVRNYVFGKFGTGMVNPNFGERMNLSWLNDPVGGYGYSGWVWDFPSGEFKLKQGPKVFSKETSMEVNS